MPSNWAKLIFAGLAVPLVLLLVAFAVWGLPIIFPGANYRKVVSVQHEFISFRHVIYELDAKNLPPPLSLTMAAALLTEPGLKTFRTGIDPWGTVYYYHVDKAVRPDSDLYTVTVRSYGPNRRDDHGGGDDLQQIYQVYVATKRAGREQLIERVDKGVRSIN